MEKFGIFELLDALSAMTEMQAPPTPPKQEEEKPPERKPNTAFSTQAATAFLAKHDAISRKIHTNR